MKTGKSAITVKDFLGDPATSVDPLLIVSTDMPIEELVRQMTSLDEDRIILVEEAGAIVGLISLGDLARHLRNTRSSDHNLHSLPLPHFRGYRGRNVRHSGRDILHTVTAETAGDIMRTQLRFCRPEDPLSVATHTMLDGEVIKLLPVLNQDGSLAGTLHLLDLMEYLLTHPSQD